MALSASTFLSDSTLFVRDGLSTNITDPIVASRAGRERFVMTSYPKRGVKYPIITVRPSNPHDDKRLGMQSEGTWTFLPFEVRVWARNEKEKDFLTQEVITFLRTNQFGTDSSVDFELHDYKWVSSFDVDEEGEEGIKSRVMEIQYKAVIL